ncbi:uncharacterized protein EI97DRAFT_278499 [Westerdykella ornata]|uniref:Life-span regulatory factor-domain-containing protein n=1 Tax=Westerdykella ornata TaxID=318751 RepID=A0A6A6JP58_WESOR|nr:uncharacterized protein EI97DRAFT_278499 [Westerdykella ornata]KAF2277923.1 hypothetical protein EI97DRAFT_278499 [Westerdykella ornata]
MATHHVRSHSGSKRTLPAHSRQTRPAPLSKRSTNASSKKVAPPKDPGEYEDSEDMATSFLQFCTTCEKQIIVPSNFVLYCSESCKRQDHSKQLPPHCSPTLLPYMDSSLEDVQFPDIVAPRTPTTPMALSKRSSWNLSEPSSEENPTSSEDRPGKETEASAWLRKFYRVPPETSGQHVRPRYHRASSSIATTHYTTPSLSHTPSSTLSFSVPYTPSTQALPPKTNPHYSSSGSRSIDLVTAYTYPSVPSSPQQQYSLKSPPSSTMTPDKCEGKFEYQKSPIPSLTSADGTLKQLLASSGAATQ